MWSQVTSLFEAALEQSAEERGQFLQRSCSDVEIRNEVLRLLENCEEMGGFLSEGGSNVKTHMAASAAPTALKEGQILADRFSVLRLIARGGMGEVYSALDVEEETLVAIKTIRVDLLSANLLERFRREVQLAKQVTHPNICRVYGLFRHYSPDGQSMFFISMEFLAGETLAKQLYRVKRLSTAEALPLILQIAAALGAAHDADILHRDLKPENVMLVPHDDGVRAVVMDFGVALSATTERNSNQSTRLTGTPAYMSPEQLEGKKLTPASDIYSLGLVIYRMVTGTNAFEENVDSSIFSNRLGRPPKLPRELMPELSGEWEALILKCIEPELDSRMPNAQSVIEALSCIEAPAVGKIARRQAVRIGVQIVVLILVGASLLYWLTRSSSNRDADLNVAHHSLLLEGLQKLGSGDPLAARPLLERQVVKEPTFGPGHAALSAALLSLGYEALGTKEARIGKNLRNGLPPEDSLFVMGQYYESIFDLQRALKSFETLHALAPEKPEWALRYSLALSKAGKRKEAFEVLEKVKSLKKVNELSLRTGLVEATLAESGDDYTREQRVAELVEDKAKAVGLLYQAGHAELQEGWALDNQGRFSDAESKIVTAKNLLIRITDRGGEGQAWKLLGDIYADQSRLQSAKSAYQRATVIFAAIGWTSGRAIALNNAGYVLRDLGDLQGAREAFEQSLIISRNIGNLKAQALALNGAAIVLKRMGNLSGAEQAYLADIEIAQRLSEDGSLATGTNNLAIVLQDEGKLPEAKQNLDRALAIFQRLGRQADVAMVLGNLGDVELKGGNLIAAKNFYKSDIGISESISQPDNIGHGLLGLGEVYFLKSDFGRAQYYLAKSLSVRNGLHEAGEVAESSLALAELDLEEKNFGSAQSRAKTASDEFASERQEDQEAQAQAILAESLVGTGNPAQAKLAADSAIKLLANSEDMDSLVNARLHLWTVFHASGRNGEALQILKTAFLDATKCRYVAQALEARLFIAQLQLKSPEAEQELSQIRAEAASKGMALISRKASSRSRDR
jgi:serine/threonine protein kinase